MNRIRALHAVCLLVLSLALYSRTATYDFAYDDVLQIVHNPAVTEDPAAGLNVKKILMTPTPPGNLYRPLTTLTYRTSFLFAGLNQKALHVKNIAIYALCCLVVYCLFLGLTPKSSPHLAFVAAALFTVHPTHIEVVANIIGRAEVLTLLFGALAVLLFKRAVEADTGYLYALASSLMFLLACLSKESGLTLLALIPLYALFSDRQTPKKLKSIVLHAFPLALAAAAALWLRYLALGNSFRILSDGKTIYPENPIFHLSTVERFVPSLKILGDYIAQTILPIRLSADYSAMPETFLASVYSPSGILLAALPLGVLWLIFLKRHSSYMVAGLWFFVGFALTCNILTPIGTIRADRLLFLPGAGLILFFTCAINDLLNSPRYRPLRQLLPALFCIFFIGRTWARTPVWQSNAVLFPQTVLDAPLSPKAHYNMAVEHFRKSRLREASREVSAALELHPRYLFAARLQADISYRKGDVTALEQAYRKILSIEPGDKTVQKYLSILEEKKKAKLQTQQ